MKRTFRSLATTTVVLTLLLIAWGGVVRATGSGDGCPDWPTCFGRWIPRAEYHTLIEYTHRLLAFLAGFASLALAAVGGWSLIRRGPVDRLTAWLAVALLPLFVVQALIGGWIIHSGEDPSVVTLHFAVGVPVELHYLDVPVETLWERVAARNADLPSGSFRISRAN